MIYQIEVFLHRLRQQLSRSEWMIRLLGLSRLKDTDSHAGLVMIQIDGLSKTQLERALAVGRMPFLNHLLQDEHYGLHTLYSGLPSSTPAVQGELFYGVKGIVPAFSFFDRSSGRIVRMFEPDPVADVERELEHQGDPLLAGGSSYSNIFTGGAAESHYCVSSVGWGKLQTAPRPLVPIVFMLLNMYGLLRTTVLLLFEFVLAVFDSLRGIIRGRDLMHELRFVPTRVAICVLLRELVTAGVKVDVARGMPVVHLNFLGYDEQAHRRGPSSLFAHWSLKGIDDAIARIWRAAKRSTRREYDVWIYSDHGQENTVPYAKLAGRSIEQTVSAALSAVESSVVAAAPGSKRQAGIQTQRARLLGGHWLQRLLPALRDKGGPFTDVRFVLTAMGPVGMIYSPQLLTPHKRHAVANYLMTEGKVPLVLARDGDDAGSDKLRAWCRDSEYLLPDQAGEVLGEDHPFLAEVCGDLLQLSRHAKAGELMIFGWCRDATACSFPIENGSHAGIAPEECRAFALIPEDVALPKNNRDYLRPRDLRQAALHLLKRPLKGHLASQGGVVTSRAGILRVMTYNVHSCIGMDGKLSMERIARVIARYKPDIVALQELDVGRQRTGGVDQAAIIAEYLQMKFHFHPTIHLEEERYGDAILTHLPMRLVKAERLPEPSSKPLREARGALWVTIEVDGVEVQVINTHFGLSPAERMVQTQALLSRDWLAHPQCRAPVLLCGDFNAMPNSAVCRRLGERLRDVQLEMATHRPKKTFSGRYPAFRIDHIFVDPAVTITHVDVPSTHLTRTASDHLPLIADIRLPR